MKIRGAKIFCIACATFVLLSFSFPEKNKIRIFMVGDSTMKSYDTSRTPQRGWGQELYLFFNYHVEIINEAHGGRSTKSYIKDGLWQSLVDSLHKGDWVFIQFGHNDHDKRKPERYTPPDDYKRNLIRMVQDVRAKGAHPLLFTPIAMRTFNKEGVYYDGHGVYPEKVKEAAKETHAPVIDLDKKFGQVIRKAGPEKSKALFMNFGAGIYKQYPEGHKDNTHLRTLGAKEVARLAIEEIKRQRLKPLVNNMLSR